MEVSSSVNFWDEGISLYYWLLVLKIKLLKITWFWKCTTVNNVLLQCINIFFNGLLFPCLYWWWCNWSLKAQISECKQLTTELKLVGLIYFCIVSTFYIDCYHIAFTLHCFTNNQLCKPYKNVYFQHQLLLCRPELEFSTWCVNMNENHSPWVF